MDPKLKQLIEEIRAKYELNKQDHPWAGTIAEVKALGDRQIEAIVATDAIDRHGEILSIEGVDLKAYKQNPVVLWAHDYGSLPIAKAVGIKKEDGKIVAKMEFNENDEFAMKVYQAIKDGFLNAFSIGFIPTDAKYIEGKDALMWTQSEMIEFSVVPVPANAEALVQAKALMAEAITKAGKVLSAKNRDALVAARDAIDAVLNADQGEDDKNNEQKGLTEIIKNAASAAEDFSSQATEQEEGGRSSKKRKILLVKAKKAVQIADKAAEMLINSLNEKLKK